MAFCTSPLPQIDGILKDLMTDCFGKRVQRNWNEILTNIKLVDLHIKPAYLLDHGVKSAQDLSSLIQRLHEEKYLRNKLKIVTVEMDLLVMDIKYLTEYFSSWDRLHCLIIVDVSKTLSRPRKYESEDLISKLKHIVEDVCTSNDDIIDINCSNCNVTTLFGLLLGYPALYWYEEDTDNCLAMEPLSNFKVEGIVENGNKHLVFSFSLPRCVLSDKSDVISKWFHYIKANTNWKEVFKDIVMGEMHVQLSAVSL